MRRMPIYHRQGESCVQMPSSGVKCSKHFPRTLRWHLFLASLWQSSPHRLFQSFRHLQHKEIQRASKSNHDFAQEQLCCGDILTLQTLYALSLPRSSCFQWVLCRIRHWWFVVAALPGGAVRGEPLASRKIALQRCILHCACEDIRYVKICEVSTCSKMFKECRLHSLLKYLTSMDTISTRLQ